MKQKYYGWKIATICLGLFLIGATLSVSIGVFYPALINTHGFTQTEVSMIVSLYTLGGLVSALIYKTVATRMKLRIAVFIFALAQTVCVFGMSLASSLQEFYILGFIGGFFGTNLPSFGQLLVTRWFDKKRGTAMAVLVAGTGINQIIVLPILVGLIDGVNYQSAFVAYSALMLFVAVMALLRIKEYPQDIGLEKDGVIKFGGNVGGASRKAGAVEVPFKKIIFHKSFLTLQLLHQLVSVIGMAVALQLTSYLTSINFSAEEIASFFVAFGIISFIFRFMVGIFVDRIGLIKSNLLWGVFGLIAIGSLLVLPISPNFKYIYMIATGGGLSYTQVITGIAYTRFYGDESLPKLQPINKVVGGICTAIGIVISGMMIDRLGFTIMYAILFVVFAFAVMIGHVAMVSGTNLQKKYKQEQEAKSKLEI